MTQFNLAAERLLPAALKALLLETPAWTRLEPVSVTGDPSPGLDARVYDPMWMLLRQWQLGEFEGEDAGTPISVEVKHRTRPINAWKPGGLGSGEPARPLGPGETLDVPVEREPGPVPPGWWARAEAGDQLADMLEDAGAADGVRLALVAACPLPQVAGAGAGAGTPEAHTRLPEDRDLIARHAPDGLAAAEQLEDAAAPEWLAGASEDVRRAAGAWLTWFRENIAPASDNPSWVEDRLEHRFAVRGGSGRRTAVMEAPAHEGGEISWHAFDAVTTRQDHFGEVEADEDEAPADHDDTLTMLASPLRYAGMPAARYWEFEDARVNFAALDAQPNDIARMIITEFAMVYGNDWVVVPLTVRAGSIVEIDEVAYTTTFGERIVVDRADDGRGPERFRMFEISRADDEDRTEPWLVIPPSAPGVQEGPPLEDVLFLRDEMANMAWAVERTVQGASGDPRSRGDEPRPVPPVAEPLPGTDVEYRLQSEVPAHWIPLVPISTGIGSIALRKGTMADEDLSLGTILDPTPLTIQDEEIPREGLRVRRLPALARASDGRYVRWITRRASVGRGEGSSGLAFDAALTAGERA